MAMEKTIKVLAREWEEKYGKMSLMEYNESVRGAISSKLGKFVDGIKENITRSKVKYDLPYGGLVKAVAESKKKISELELKIEELRKTKKDELEAEYDSLKKADNLNSNTIKDLWVSERLLQYMQKSDGVYAKAKQELIESKQDLSIFLAKKEEREAELAPVIEAERYRTMREELLSADPDALRELGISPLRKSVIFATKSAVDKLPDGDYMEGTRQDDYWLELFMKSRGYGNEKK